MKKSRILGMVALLASVVLLAVGCVSSKQESLSLRDNEIPTLYSVVGEREIVGTDTEVTNDTQITTLTYQKNSVSQADVDAYVAKLKEDGFEEISSMVLSKASQKEGEQITITIALDENGSTTIQYTAGK